MPNPIVIRKKHRMELRSRLPLDIYTIVYRYLYSTVLDELSDVYGKTLRLKFIMDDQLCERIRTDVVNYYNSRPEKGWNCACTINPPVSNARVQTWYAYWEAQLYDLDVSSIN